jgi:hypothetical protein
MPSDSARPSTAAAAADGTQASGTTAAAAVQAAVADGHALGVLLGEHGVQQLLDRLVPELALPVVVQQYVSHGEALYKVTQLAWRQWLEQQLMHAPCFAKRMGNTATSQCYTVTQHLLWKNACIVHVHLTGTPLIPLMPCGIIACLQLYVIGPNIVLTRRSTLTLEHLQQAAAAAAAGAGQSSSTDAVRPALVLLQRVSAVPLHAAHAGQGSSSHDCSEGSTPAEAVQPAEAALTCRRLSQAAAAPTAAMPATAAAAATVATQLAAQQDRKPAEGAGHSSSCRSSSGIALADSSVAGDAAAPPLWAMQQLAAFLRQQLQLNLFNVDIISPQQQHQQRPAHELHDRMSSSCVCKGSDCRQFLVVDVNFFPGFDKVPGAEQLFADYLASLKRSDSL